MVGPRTGRSARWILAMLTDYIEPEERLVACPNQDVVYGAGSLALDLSPVVIQVPDFGDPVLRLPDRRSAYRRFVPLGKIYGATPGFYLLVGPNWRGDIPKGIPGLPFPPPIPGFVGPHVFQDDTAEDRRRSRACCIGSLMYPLAEYDGRMKSADWSKIKKAPTAAAGEAETKWVFPEKSFDQLPEDLAQRATFTG